MARRRLARSLALSLGVVALLAVAARAPTAAATDGGDADSSENAAAAADAAAAAAVDASAAAAAAADAAADAAAAAAEEAAAASAADAAADVAAAADAAAAAAAPPAGRVTALSARVSYAAGPERVARHRLAARVSDAGMVDTTAEGPPLQLDDGDSFTVRAAVVDGAGEPLAPAQAFVRFVRRGGEGGAGGERQSVHVMKPRGEEMHLELVRFGGGFENGDAGEGDGRRQVIRVVGAAAVLALSLFYLCGCYWLCGPFRGQPPRFLCTSTHTQEPSTRDVRTSWLYWHFIWVAAVDSSPLHACSH